MNLINNLQATNKINSFILSLVESNDSNKYEYLKMLNTLCVEAMKTLPEWNTDNSVGNPFDNSQEQVEYKQSQIDELNEEIDIKDTQIDQSQKMVDILSEKLHLAVDYLINGVKYPPEVKYDLAEDIKKTLIKLNIGGD